MSSKEITRGLEDILKKMRKQNIVIQRVILCSVVPAKLNIVKKFLKERFPVFTIGEDILVPIKNNYKNPKQVGEDRLVCAYAAKELHGYPVIIIDFGTAITFDVVSKEGAYEGGMILPGIRLSFESLHLKTALLPLITKMKVPQQLIGKDTKESMLSGIFHGYVAMCEGLIDKLTQKVPGRLSVVITGGYASLLSKFIQRPHYLEPRLIYQGINLVLEKNVSPKGIRRP